MEPKVKLEDVDIYVKDRLLEKETVYLASAASKLTQYREAKTKIKEHEVLMTVLELNKLLSKEELEVLKKCTINPKFIKLT